MTTTISRGRFKDHITKYMKLAQTETIIITHCKEPKWVLMPFQEFTRASFDKSGLRIF